MHRSAFSAGTLCNDGYIDHMVPPSGDSSASISVSPRHAVSQAVPFFNVTDIEASVRFYVDGLGFVLTNHWSPEGRIRWCWLELDKVAVMLQEYWRDGRQAGAPEGPLGQGVQIYLFCEDALAVYRDLTARGIAATRPFVGNGLWVTSVTDPDGYHLYFESDTDAPEETVYSA
jgi:lactoylglutathione lyase